MHVITRKIVIFIAIAGVLLLSTVSYSCINNPYTSTAVNPENTTNPVNLKLVKSWRGESILSDIWGSSPDDVFAVGYRYPPTGSENKNAQGVIHHYNGKSWETMESGPAIDYRNIWGRSSTDVFVTGVSLDTDSNELVSSVFHYDGHAWNRIEYNLSQWFGDLYPSFGSDIFFTGINGTILRYNGIDWKVMDSGTANKLNSIWGSSETDVFAVGEKGTIVHYDGTVWSPMQSNTTNNLIKIWGISPSNVFALCEKDFIIMHFDGVSWEKVNPGTRIFSSDISGASPNDVFTVGHKGTISHFDGETWGSVDSGTTDYLYKVMCFQSELFILSTQNILRYSR